MLTNVQVLTDDGVVTAIVEEDNKMSVAHQNLRSVPTVLMENYWHWIEVLDVSHNNLRDLSPLRALPRLHTLISDHNLISASTSLPRLPALRVLWLNFNLVSNLDHLVPGLPRVCPALTHLSLMGNMAVPITYRSDGDKELDHYRLYVIYHLDRLLYLDDAAVTPLERLRSGSSSGSGSGSGNRNKMSAYVRDLQDTLHDIKVSIVSRFNKFNEIV